MLKQLLAAFVIALCSSWVQAETFDHSLWDTLVKSHVVPIQGGSSTQVDYGALQQNRANLTAYLETLSALPRSRFDAFSKPEQLAFLINAYNAWTVELILSEYPDVESIKDLGGFFSSPWKEEFIPLFNDKVSLDYIEHDLIRGSGRYNDPRIHFAVNCASVGCPALREEAYTGSQLEKQLEQQTMRFLTDSSRNRVSNGSMQISSIFKWYRGDFEAGWRGSDSLSEFFGLYKHALPWSEASIAALQAGELDISFLDYDWRLNDTQ